MPFFIRQYPDRVTWRVHKVEAANEEEALKVELDDNKTYLGYYEDDIPRNPENLQPCVYGPYETEELADKSEFAWVQDV